MRYMIIVRATPDSEAGVMPQESLLAAMATYHEALAKAGVLLDANGLHPSSKGWRVQYDKDQRKVVDGPFAETKELIAGYTMIQVRSREEAMQWALRFPQPFPGQSCAVEVRQVFELDEFGPSEGVERYRRISGNGQ
ncbi:YciI family protein [Achromobacter sp. K91]|uniref:YciI family protein n=1 Tax=Achromobacter sp. K91 TaxID=2292262 RepID=UPI000E664151|nr:YciI family protein [Achromobacter sp. K91]RIJ05444.1 YciI family protein [Achromobacter sp. K91]